MTQLKTDREKMIELFEDLDIEVEVKAFNTDRSVLIIQTGGDAWTEFSFDEVEMFQTAGTYHRAKQQRSAIGPPPIRKKGAK